MRLIGMPVMCLLLAGCAIPPIFPSEVMKDVEQNSSAIETWKEQSYRSSANFVPHKVVLAGQIMRVLTKSEGIVLLVAEKPMEKYRGHDFTRVQVCHRKEIHYASHRLICVVSHVSCVHDCPVSSSSDARIWT